MVDGESVMQQARPWRVLLAVVLAPLVPGLLVLLRGLALDDHYAWWAAGLFLMPGYLVMLTIGVPVILLARSKRWALDLKRCIAAGVLCGLVAILPFWVFDPTGAWETVESRLQWALNASLLALVSGTLAGTVFWMMAGSRQIPRDAGGGG